MSDDHDRHLAVQLADGAKDLLFILEVERARCFIEHEQSRPTEKRARKTETLFLAAGEPDPPLTDQRIESLRQRGNEVERRCLLERIPHLGFGRARFRPVEVEANRFVEEECVLRNVADQRSPRPEVEIAEIQPVNANLTRRRAHQSQKQVGDGALPRTGWSDDRCRPSGLDDHVDRRELSCSGQRIVAKRDIAKLDSRCERRR